MIVALIITFQSSIVSVVLGIASVVTLIILMITKELAGSYNSSFCVRISQASTIAIIPLAIALAVTVIVKVIELL